MGLRRREEAPLPLTYRFKTKPYPHQVKGLRKLLDTKYGGALLMEPRTGKTKVLIDWVSILHQGGKCDRVLVVCPVSVMGVWEREIAMHCPWRYRIVVWDRKARREQPLPTWGAGTLDFVIVNYDAFSVPGRIEGSDAAGNRLRSGKRGGKYDVKNTLIRWGAHAIILDESHRIKKTSAAKTKTILRVAHRCDKTQRPVEERIHYRAIATGTPVTKGKRTHDVYSQWMFLNPQSQLVHGIDQKKFRERFSIEVDKGKYKLWLRNKNVDVLRRLMHVDAYSITRQEAFPHLKRLPDNLIPVELTRDTAQAYDDMAAEMIAQIRSGEVVEATIPLVQGMRLLQIASGLARTSPEPERPEGRLVRIGSDKLDALMDRLEDLWEADEKVVIGANFVPDIVAITKAIRGKGKKAWPHFGRIKPKQRTQFIDEFQRYQGPACFVMQPQTGSLGIDLSAASIGIWYSMGRSWVDFTQMEDRIALAGQTTWEYLIAAPIDQIIYDAHQIDADIGKYIISNPEALLRT